MTEEPSQISQGKVTFRETIERVAAPYYPYLIKVYETFDRLCEYIVKIWPVSGVYTMLCIGVVVQLYYAYKLGKNNSLNINDFEEKINKKKLYLQSQTSKKKSYEKLIKKISFIQSWLYMGVSLLFILSCALAYFSQTPEQSIFQIFISLIAESAIAYYITIVIAVIMYLTKSMLDYKKSVNNKYLSEYIEEKDTYLNEFFKRIGPVLFEEVQNHFKLHLKSELEDCKEKLAAENEDLGNLKKENNFLHIKTDSYVKLVEDLSKFVWCKDCGALGRGYQYKRKGNKAGSVISHDDINVNKNPKRKNSGDLGIENLLRSETKIGTKGLDIELKKSESGQDKNLGSTKDQSKTADKRETMSLRHIVDDKLTSSVCDDDEVEEYITPPTCQEQCLKRYFSYCAKAGRDFKKRLQIN